jgi:hypothetical protein
VARAVDSHAQAAEVTRPSPSRPPRLPLAERRFGRIALLLALVGAVHGLVYVPFVSPHIRTDSWTYVAAAEALLDGSYTTPLQASSYYVHPVGFFDHTGRPLGQEILHLTERQTFRPPGYPLFLAALGGGGGGASETAALVAQAVLFGVAVWLLAITVRRWWGPTPALLAAGLYAIDPYSKHYVTLVLSEGLAAPLALGTAYAFTRAWQGRSPAWWAATGALAASLTLVRAVFVVVVALALLAAALRGAPFGARVRAVTATGLAAAVLIAPWLAWTASVTGSPVLASWGEGYNFLVAAHGEGLGRTQTEVDRDPAFRRDFDPVRRLAPTAAELRSDPEAHPRYLEAADAELRDRAQSRYAERLADEPLQVAWEFVYRAFFLWNAHEDWLQPDGAALVALRVVDAVVLVLAVIGAALAWARGGAARGVALALLAYTVVLATHHVEARFAMPVRGLALAFVTLALMSFASRRPARRSTA